MSQKNYIQDIDVPESNDLLPNQLFYFSGFLFYVEGWSWDNIAVDSNIQYQGVRDSLDATISNFASNSFEAIRDIRNNSSPVFGDNITIAAGDSYRFPELYAVAATCRRFQIYNTWRPRYNDIITPEFFESYSQDIPSRAPLGEGELTWPLWAGDIQSYSNIPGGNLEVGNYIFAKKLSLQKYTPTSIQNSSKNLKTDLGFGEIDGNYITNYYNPVNSYVDELSTLRNGWYGVVSLESTPYTFQAGRGINFDTFIKLESSRITSFHEDYPQNNISTYGQKRKQYINS